MMCLLLTALIWGLSFVAQVQGMDAMSPMFFNATRFTLGAVCLLPLLWVRCGKKRAVDASETPKSAARRIPQTLIPVICGLALFAASTAQQYGIMFGRSAGRAGFLTALYIVMVPLLAAIFLRRRIGASVVIAVALAVVGFYFLCITDGFGSLGPADWLLLGSALLFAVHILVIDETGSRIDPIVLSFGQFATTAALSWVGAIAEGSVDWTAVSQAWMPIVYAGVGSVGIAYTLQVVGQQWVPPTRASLILSLESFFSALGGALFLGETMTGRGYFGCALIFAGTLLAQMPVGTRSLSPSSDDDKTDFGTPVTSAASDAPAKAR